MKKIKPDLLQGTLDLLVLKTLQSGPTHGWDIAQRNQQVSQDVLRGPGIVVSSTSPAGGGGLDRFRVGIVGKQSKGIRLQTDCRRNETFIYGEPNRGDDSPAR